MNGPNQNMETRCPQCGALLPAGALEGLCPACLLKQGAAAETGPPPEAGPFQPPSVEELAKLFPQLEILAFIGKGGMGAVYKARQPALDRVVALKILPPQAATSPGFAERFTREARALARLSHPNIVAVHEFGQVNALPFFIMEFVDGLNLRQLEQAGKLSPREALQIVPQICEALQFAHDEGIVHRDIKPENILVDKKGRVKIADFGIAKIIGREAEAGLTETRGAIGTPQYMAPEQVEKPQEVDHRADIFSLGVVFYEMLTGELPLGKFAPPSSCMHGVAVDVRIDEVVLRALEKEPERRYQQASQVKTAVETISSTEAPAPPPDADALAREILARDYVLDIGSCLARAWALVKSDFWPIVGISALMLLLIHAAWSTAIGLVAGGPLLGGLCLYYLKKIRGQQAGIETCFSGFSIAFLQLFLAGCIVGVLTFLGFVCFVLPGMFLAVIWWFAVPLVIDKRLDFWPAMELSRKVVLKHFWKFLGFWLICIFMYAAGLAMCVVGFLIAAPIAMIASTFAYEDIFGAGRSASAPSSPRVGPSGTVILPGNLSPPVPPAGGSLMAPGLAVAAMVIVLLAGITFLNARAHRRQAVAEMVMARQAEASDLALTRPSPVMGQVKERVVIEAINFGTGNLISPPNSASKGSESTENLAENIRHLELLGVDAYGEGLPAKLYGLGMTLAAMQAEDWDAITPELIQEAISLAATNGAPLVKMEVQDEGTNTYAFRTREAVFGILQVLGLTDDQRGVKIHYKLVEQSDRGLPGSNESRALLRQTLEERLEAASTISASVEKDRALAIVARDSAKAGEVELVQNSLEQIAASWARDEAARESALVLARRGLRKPAIEIAKSISSNPVRDQVLTELAK